MNKMTRKIFTIAELTANITGMATLALAGGLVRINLEGSGATPNASGVIIVENNDSAADTLLLQVLNLEAHKRHTLFITQSASQASLPVQFLAEFTTDRRGRGQLFSACPAIVPFRYHFFFL